MKVSAPSTRRLPTKHRKALGPSGLQAGRCFHLKNVYQVSTKVTFAARKGGFFVGLSRFQNLRGTVRGVVLCLQAAKPSRASKNGPLGQIM